MKCKMAAPQKVLYPPLTYRSPAGKLCFALCRSCCDKPQGPCPHTEAGRTFTGSWSTVQIDRALARGYKVLDIYEVWHYKEKLGKDETMGFVG